MERAAKSAAPLVGRLFGPSLRFALLMPAALVLCFSLIQSWTPFAARSAAASLLTLGWMAGSAAELVPVVVALVRLTLVTETRTRFNVLVTAVGFLALIPAARAAVVLLSG